MATIQNIPGNEAPATSRAKINSNFTAVNDEVVAATSAVAGKENSGTAAAAVAAHVAAGDPHTQYAPKADAPLTGNTTYQRMSPGMHDHGSVASGTVTLNSTLSANRVTLTGTAMTVAFPAGDPRNLQTLLVTNSNAADATITVPSSRSLNSNATITNFTLSAGITALLTWYYDGTTYFLLGETLTSSQVKVALALVAADLSDFAAAARAQVEAMLTQSTNITLTPSGSGASRQIAVSATGGGGGGIYNVVSGGAPDTNYTGTDTISGGAPDTTY